MRFLNHFQTLIFYEKHVLFEAFSCEVNSLNYNVFRPFYCNYFFEGELSGAQSPTPPAPAESPTNIAKE